MPYNNPLPSHGPATEPMARFACCSSVDLCDLRFPCAGAVVCCVFCISANTLVCFACVIAMGKLSRQCHGPLPGIGIRCCIVPGRCTVGIVCGDGRACYVLILFHYSAARGESQAPHAVHGPMFSTCFENGGGGGAAILICKYSLKQPLLSLETQPVNL